MSGGCGGRRRLTSFWYYWTSPARPHRAGGGPAGPPAGSENMVVTHLEPVSAILHPRTPSPAAPGFSGMRRGTGLRDPPRPSPVSAARAAGERQAHRRRGDPQRRGDLSRAIAPYRGRGLRSLPHPSEPLRIACTGIPGSQDAEVRTRSRSCSTRRRLTQLRVLPDTMGHEALPRLGPERSSLHDATVTLRIPPHSYVRRSPAAVERCGPARARVRGLPGDQALPAPAAAVGGNRSPACGAVRPAGRRAPRGPGRGARSRTRPVKDACWGGIRADFEANDRRDNESILRNTP